MNPNWQRKRLKHICTINPSKSEVRLADDAFVTFVPMERATEDGVVRTTETRRLAEVRQGFTYFRDEDVLLAKITPCFENGKGGVCVGLTNGVGFGSTEFHVLRAGEQLDPRFLFYITRTSSFRTTGEVMMYGAAGQQRVPDEFIQNWVVDLPPLPEQQAITAFLDRKTAEIDAVVAKKERLIALLQEKRQALISRAVTRGLDAGVAMKDSGVPWLGEVPGHWESVPLGYAVSVIGGSTPSKDNLRFWEGAIPWVSPKDMKRWLIGDAEDHVTDYALGETSLTLIQPPAV